MKKVVLKLDVHDEKCKQRAMKIASNISGLDSLSIDMKEKKLTLTGDIDPVAIVSKLRKVYQTEIVSVGPIKEPEKKKDGPKKEEPNKEEPNKKKNQNKKVGFIDQAQGGHLVTASYSPPRSVGHGAQSKEDNPNSNSCVIC